MEKWHELNWIEVAERVEVDVSQGLSDSDAARRLAEHGPNELEERGAKSPWRILWEQLTDTMVVILIIASIVSVILGDMKEAIAIVIIVALNALLGFRQEYKAERAMAALKALAVPTVRIYRAGAVKEVSAREVVPGDVLLLEAGNLVPADGRLFEAVNLRIQESALTGESEPVEKSTEAAGRAEQEISVADRHGMAHMGTVVTYGRGRMIVTETGMKTELGRIAALIQSLQAEATPLQRRLKQVGRGLATAALALVTVVFVLGLFRREDIKEMFFVAISLAVAAVPEGLPAVVTIALALGSQRMLRRRALIRKLPAVETLGSVTVICSDKTGTLTQNRMTVTTLDVADCELKIDPHVSPLLQAGGEAVDPGEASGLSLEDSPPAISILLLGGALCNDSRIVQSSDGEKGLERLQAVGDPTETAMVVAATRLGLDKEHWDRILPRVGELPFDSDRKRMTTVHKLPDLDQSALGALGDYLRAAADDPGGERAPYIAFTKGAVDSVLAVSGSVLAGERVDPLGREWLERISAANDRLAADGMRVLGVGCRLLPSFPTKSPDQCLEQELVFVGLMGMIDPARPEARNAVATCRSAGIRPVMITGDHPLTAKSIARDLGIATEGRVLTGGDLAALSVEELEAMVEEVSVYARVSPEHKLNIVQALQNRSHIVAMTGDGVNDAPALRRADIGLAMGITGTDVTKEVADMVLLDDNFATIVAAVEEGRIIYDNIRKFIKYLLTTNSGEIWLMLLAPFLGMPLPLLPLQILWINLVTDGLPALALGVEPAERDIMRRPPYRPNENVFARGLGRHIIWVGFLMGILPLVTGYEYWKEGSESWQTMVFTIMTFAQMCHALAIRSLRYSLFTIGLFSNKALLGAVLLTFSMQVAVIYVPWLQIFFKTVALPAKDFFLCVAVSTIIFWAVEIEKWLGRR